MFFWESWQIKKILQRFCNNKAHLWEHFVSYIYSSSAVEKEKLFFLDLSLCRMDPLFILRAL